MEKLTDEQIIKALECCGRIKGQDCDTCPLTELQLSECTAKVATESLDLIRRKDTEIAEQNAEIKKLRKRIAGQKHALFKQQSYTAELQNELKAAKSETIKEFAERLKKCETKVFGSQCRIIPLYCIDSIVKEMVGAL